MSGRWSIQLSRRLDDGNGQLIGVIVLSFDPEYLQRTFATLDIGAGSAAVLYGEDASLLARHPALPNIYGGPPHTALFGKLERAGVFSTGMFSGQFRSPLDGKERIASFRKTPGLPLVVGICGLGLGLPRVCCQKL